MFTSNSKKAAGCFFLTELHFHGRVDSIPDSSSAFWLLPGLREFMGSSEDLGPITGMGRKRWESIYGFVLKNRLFPSIPPKKWWFIMVYHSDVHSFLNQRWSLGHWAIGPSERQRPSRSPWCAPANTRRLVVWGTDAAVAMGRDSRPHIASLENILLDCSGEGKSRDGADL